MQKKIISTLLICFLGSSPAWADRQSQDDQRQVERAAEQARLARELALEEARQSRLEALEQKRQAQQYALTQAVAAQETAQRSVESARHDLVELQQLAAEQQAIAAESRGQSAEARQQRNQQLAELYERMRDAQRQLRDVSKEVARAQRDLARAARDQSRQQTSPYRIAYPRSANRGVIGLIMGQETDRNGVRVIGITPDGPAEKAGIQPGDVIISINGQDLESLSSDDSGTDIIRESMQEIEPGDDVELSYERDGDIVSVTLEAQRRQPQGLDYLLAPAAPGAPPHPQTYVHPTSPMIKIIEKMKEIDVPDVDIELPEGDMEALELHLKELEERLKGNSWAVGAPHYRVDVTPPEDGQSVIRLERFSDLASGALDNAFVFFGNQLWSDIEMASLNQSLGEYFQVDQGVLVVRAGEDNKLQLKSGDVILELNGIDMESPSEVIRELRSASIDDELDITIVRKGERQSYSITVPEPEGPVNFGFRYNFSTAPEDQ